MSAAIQKLLAENLQPSPGRRGWHGGPTPVGALRGVDARQASWRPGAGRKSVWELALHIAYWKYAVRRRLEGAQRRRRDELFARSPSNWPAIPAVVNAATWAEDVRLLRDEHARLVEVVRRVPAGWLDRKPPGGRQWTYGELIVGIAQHDAYHTGQIQVVKRLWSEQGRRS
ncbi:DinB family protein [soil metagenome]